MKENRPSSTVNQKSPRPRHRLSQKQLWFLNNVFVANQHVSDALGNLCIRPSTFQRWLTKPLFLERLRMHISHAYLEARVELARNVPRAVSGLSFLSEKSLRHTEVRKACTDILTFYQQMAKTAAGSKTVQNGSVLDNFGAFLEQFGNVLDKKGAALDKFGNTNTPKNRVFDTENEENANFTPLIPENNPQYPTPAAEEDVNN